MTNRLRFVDDQSLMPRPNEPDRMSRVLTAAAKLEVLRHALARARAELKQALDEAAEG